MKENMTHSIEDSLKLLECGVSALRKELTHYPNTSLATFRKLKVFSLQIIKTQVTLSEVSLHDKQRWKFIEKSPLRYRQTGMKELALFNTLSFWQHYLYV
jgi:hypothetical protein